MVRDFTNIKMGNEKFKLKFELVPDSCWYSNLRSILSKKEWDYIRHDAYDRANGKCMICNRKVSRLEAHEVWQYDEKTCTQILVDVVAVCNSCHQVIHIGRTSLTGNMERAEDWYMKFNNCSYAKMKEELGKATADHQRRNKVSEWKLDLSFLERYIK